MAFNRVNFAPVGGQASRGAAPAVFTYKSADPAVTVDTTGYFNGVAGMLEVGDVIRVLVVVALGTVPEVVSAYGEHVVLTNVGGVVDVSNATIGVVVNTD